MSATPAAPLSRPPADTGPAETARRLRAHWRRNLRITGALLAIWFVVSFVITFFARELSFTFFGWPFSFWVASQGALLVYLILIGCYARTMNRLDREYGLAEDDEA